MRGINAIRRQESAMDVTKCYLIAVAAVIVAATVAALHTYRSGKAHRKKEIRVHCFVFLLGVFFCVLFYALLFFGLRQESGNVYKSASLIILTAPLFLLGIAPVLLYANYKIEFDGNGFAYSNVFRMKRKYGYDDVSGMVDDKFQPKLVMRDGKRLRINAFSMGSGEFIKAIELWRHCNGEPSRKIPKAKPRLLNDNVHDAGGLVAVWVFSIIVTGSYFASTIVMSLYYKNCDGAYFTGAGLMFVVVFGLLFRYFIRNAERYPKIVKHLVKHSYIKNPAVLQFLAATQSRKKRNNR